MRILLLAIVWFGMLPVRAQTAEIRWSPSRVLRVSDFAIVKAGRPRPPSLGRNMAVTRTGFVYSITRGSGTGKGTVMIRIYAQMDPAHSFILEKVIKGDAADRAYLFNHEQKHFDISEIYARELSRFLRTQSRGNPTMDHITKEANRLFTELNAFQKKYDAATNNGRNKAMQAHWNAIIAQRLKALESYAAKDYMLSGYR
ncbi:DUF922 domain-containing protein [Niabella drilacis]|uniref:DUF922 domain-containing protein n=1 Tax=Niabella drilacis (strain DSM 25811 / CCM 8410 / CCUG 62505 / LMG 26954 / E90) TaxID=1285928 RepID=A0A1G6KTF5_NIADE|nr:DUF922 domain-containing protein [Niabella drilacis]SDC33775.1 protein of unknown function [Niabella drilacis]